MRLDTVDSCDVLVLVDNVSDLLSTVPASVTGEITNIVAAGAKEVAGHCLCCAQWGLALVVRATRGEQIRTVLFDAGPEGYGVERNGNRLGLDFGSIDAAVFSHGHWDHVGGIETALRLINEANGGRPVPVHVNDGMFAARAMPRPGLGLMPMGEVPSKAAITAAGGKVVAAPGARLLLDDFFFLSGEIPRRTSYELGMPGQVAKDAAGDWQPDPLVSDERWLAVHVRDLGILVFTACSHAGVINVLHHARETFAPLPLYGVMGGLHLSGAAAEPRIPATIEDMKEFGLKSIVAGHCTGWRAMHRLVEAFGEAVVVPSAVGRRHIYCH